MSETIRESASFRDPSGFVFTAEGTLYRQVNQGYREHYECLMSGLYKELTDRGLILSHEEASVPAPEPECAWKVLRPELLSFISYPYEWCFSQLKDAALLTLEVQQTALKYGMWLKDASAYNVQFRRGRPVWIDTLSFEKVRPGEPWPAYRQFCRHFLAPLALARYRGTEVLRGLTMHLDGFPLQTASRWLPRKTFFRPSLLIHIHLHAKAETRWGDFRAGEKRPAVSANALAGLVDHLAASVRPLTPRGRASRWSDYYGKKSRYTEEAAGEKKRIVSGYLDELRPGTVWDFGSNTGAYSFLAAEKSAEVFSADGDGAVIETLYRECQRRGETKILPLVLDLAEPSPALGWMGEERKSFFERCRADTGLALALLHHLAIGNNLSFAQIASFFRSVCRHLIIEFVPKDDPQAQSLLGCREDIFRDYHREGFEKAFARHFFLEKEQKIPGSERRLYLMRAL